MDDLLTAQDVKKLLKVSLASVYAMADRKQIPSIRWKCPGNGREKKMLRFKMEDLLQFIEDHRQRELGTTWAQNKGNKGLGTR